MHIRPVKSPASPAGPPAQPARPVQPARPAQAASLASPASPASPASQPSQSSPGSPAQPSAVHSYGEGHVPDIELRRGSIVFDATHTEYSSSDLLCVVSASIRFLPQSTSELVQLLLPLIQVTHFLIVSKWGGHGSSLDLEILII